MCERLGHISRLSSEGNLDFENLKVQGSRLYSEWSSFKPSQHDTPSFGWDRNHLVLRGAARVAGTAACTSASCTQVSTWAFCFPWTNKPSARAEFENIDMALGVSLLDRL